MSRESYIDRIDAEVIFQLLERIIGSIEPVADSAVDEKIYDNIQLWSDVADYMVWKLKRVSESDLGIYSSSEKVIDYARRELLDLKGYLV